MLELFTTAARTAVVRAREEAVALGHPFVGTDDRAPDALPGVPPRFTRRARKAPARAGAGPATLRSDLRGAAAEAA